MVKDLPDFQSEIVSAAVEATALRSGLDADKPAAPAAGDVWLARDTGILYVCNVAGAWTNLGVLYLLLAGGTMSGAIAMGSNKITGLGTPTAAGDGATKGYVDGKVIDTTKSEPAYALGTNYENTTGKVKVVSVSVILDDMERVAGFIGSGTPATDFVAEVYNDLSAATITVQIMVIVPIGYFYRIDDAAGTPAIREWTEYTLEL